MALPLPVDIFTPCVIMKVVHMEKTMNTIHSKERADCAVVAMALATGNSYDKCYLALSGVGRKPNRRTHSSKVAKALKKMGYKLRVVCPKSVSMRTVHNHCPIGVPAMVLCTGHFVAWDGEAIVNGDSTHTRKKVKQILIIKAPNRDE
jgi:hypothetical protein